MKKQCGIYAPGGCRDLVNNSFTFGSVNSVEAWGLKVIEHDFFMPAKRERKIIIPGRSGAYDYGAKHFDERILSLECVLERKMSKGAFREIVYTLNQKKQIRLWDEPDKYYIGELYDSGEVTVYPQECMREFTLEFVCEPFAYRAAATMQIGAGENRVSYEGTAESPAILEIFNPNSYPVSNFTITAVKRRS